MKYEIYPQADGKYIAFAIKDDGTCVAVRIGDSFEEAAAKIKNAAQDAGFVSQSS